MKMFLKLCFYIGLTLIISYIFNAPYFASFSAVYGLWLIRKLFLALGKYVPFLELTLAISGLQLLISPFFDYYFFEGSIYPMNVSAEFYFSFACPSLIACHLGMSLRSKNELDLTYLENIIFDRIKKNQKKYELSGLYIVGLGLLSTLMYRSALVPTTLLFVFALLSLLKFIGVFYLWSTKSQYFRLFFFLIFGALILEAVRGAMFISVVVWAIIFYSFYIKRKKWHKSITVIAFSVGIILLGSVQLVKQSFRELAWSDEGASLTDLITLIEQNVSSLSIEDLKGVGGELNVRINQGWILSEVLRHIPEEEPTVRGESFFNELAGILLPRFLYRNKPVVNDRVKFERFTGRSLGSQTAMSVGLQGDGYGNFGFLGGVFFSFMFGLFIKRLLYLIYSISIRGHYDLLLWTPLIFFYVMRAGNDFYTITNWIVKAGILTLFYFRYRKMFSYS